MNPLSSVRAIYFDLDETLCAYWVASLTGLHKAFVQHPPNDDGPDQWIERWRAAFSEFLPEVKTAGWYSKYLVSGEPTRTEQMRRTLRQAEIDNVGLAKELSDAYADHRDRALRLYDDAVEMLHYLSQRYPLGLITNGPADVQRQEVMTLGIEPYFKAIFIEGEQGEGKPERSVFERAEAAMGLSGPELLMVGDSFDHDIVPALEAEWKAVWIVRSGQETLRSVKSLTPTLTMDQLASLKDWL
jgi:putative hydrolase of the HAD superfamily